MKNVQILKPQPSPKSSRTPLNNITNCFRSIPKDDLKKTRSPSHSPNRTYRPSTTRDNSRRIATEYSFENGISSHSIDTKSSRIMTNCANHRERVGKFRIEGDKSYNFCEDCALDLAQAGRKVILNAKDQPSSIMANEAH